jgi:hypothetical protein
LIISPETLTATLNDVQKTINENFKEFLFVFASAAIIGPILGWYIPHHLTNKEKTTQRKYLKTYYRIIDDIYKHHYKSKEKCIALLEQQKIGLIELLQDGIINDVTFRLLNSRILEVNRKLNQGIF